MAVATKIQFELVLVHSNAFFGAVDHVAEMQYFEIGFAQRHTRYWILQLARLKPALTRWERRPVPTQTQRVDAVADKVAIEFPEFPSGLGSKQLGIF